MKDDAVKKQVETGENDIPKRDKRGRLLPGKSLNPKGRPKARLTEFLADVRTAARNVALPKLVDAAQAGDMEAARTLLMAGLPRLKAVTPLQPLPMRMDTKEGDAGALVNDLVALVAAGELTAEHAEILLEAIKAKTEMQLQEELESRIAALENNEAKSGQASGVLVVPGVLTAQEWDRAANESKDF